MSASRSTPPRDRALSGHLPALLALAPLLLALLGAALSAPWHTVVTVDERTYLEMTHAISETGLPRFSNGPVDRIPALQARWNLRDGASLWGTLAPWYPYLAAPLLDLGGTRLLIRANVALLALLALSIFELGRRLSGDPWVGTAGAYLTLVATPVWNATPGVSPYTLVITLSVTAILCAAIAWTTTGAPGAQPDARVGWALAAGLLAGLATGAHLIALPLSLGLVAALLLRGVVPGLAATVGAVPPLTGVALLNHERFGGWNPVSDGPCVWRGCSAGDPQSLGAILAFAAPALVWVALTAGVLWFFRSSRRGLLLGALGAVLALALIPGVWSPAGRCLAMGWALVVDLGQLPLGEAYAVPDRGPGRLLGGFAVKSLLQASPFLALAALAPRERQKRLLLLSLPVAGLFLALVLRAGMPWDFALGHPFLNLRYLTPALPLLALLAVWAIRDLPWRLRHLLAGLVTAGALRIFWSFATGDDSLIRRLLLLRLPLVLALSAVVLVALARRHSSGPGGPVWRRVAAWSVTAGISFAAGTCQGVDLPALAQVRTVADRFVDGVAASLPERFALVAYPDQLDSPLSLALERDIEYLDLRELEDSRPLLEAVEHWRGTGRPVFILFPPGDPIEPLPGEIRFETVDIAFGLARVVSTEPIYGNPE